ncbi:MAG: hypothetical protein AB7F59_03915 [Bdellovibrionales bacterium]
MRMIILTILLFTSSLAKADNLALKLFEQQVSELTREIAVGFKPVEVLAQDLLKLYAIYPDEYIKLASALNSRIEGSLVRHAYEHYNFEEAQQFRSRLKDILKITREAAVARDFSAQPSIAAHLDLLIIKKANLKGSHLPSTISRLEHLQAQILRWAELEYKGAKILGQGNDSYMGFSQRARDLKMAARLISQKMNAIKVDTAKDFHGVAAGFCGNYLNINH